jgi:transposase
MGAAMRGSDATTGSMFSYVNIEDRVPATHPLRTILVIVNEVLASLSAEFDKMYAPLGRPSIPPEKLLRGLLIQAFFTIRSERQLMEQLNYNLLFRWFVGLGIDDEVWDHSTYSKNRDRLLEADVAKKFLKAIIAHEKVAPLLSDDHFSVDGTLVNAWASLKSFVPKEPPAHDKVPPPSDSGSQPPAVETGAEAKAEGAGIPTTGRNEDVDFRGQKRTNDTHASTTDPEARLFRKGQGKEARLSYMGHAMTENRHGLVVETDFTLATGTAEREAAIAMIERQSPGSERRITVGADKGYDTKGFVRELRSMHVTPHVAAKSKGSAIDARTTRHEGYAISQKRRKLVEEPFGWAKTIAGMARFKFKGAHRQGFAFTFAMAAYDLVRLPKLLAA